MPSSSAIQIESSTQGTTRVVALKGELDLSAVDSVQRAMDTALSERPETLVFDLSQLAFCDSSGIHLVVSSYRHAKEQGTRFIVIRPTGPAWRVFELCHIDDHVPFADSNGALEHSSNDHSSSDHASSRLSNGVSIAPPASSPEVAGI